MTPDVLVAYDFSREADRALAWAADLCRSLGGKLRLLHVVNPFPAAAAASPVVPPPPSTEDIDRLESALRDVVAPHQVPETEVEVVVGSSVGEAIVAAAADHHCNLIALGTHGRSGVRRIMLGSVAEQVLRHSPCPVTTIRAG